jgi:hypothetical protein
MQGSYPSLDTNFLIHDYRSLVTGDSQGARQTQGEARHATN